MYNLAISPAGRLHLRDVNGPDATEGPHGGWMQRVVDAFHSSDPAGLFALAATKPEAPPGPVFAYWREYISRYLIELCRIPGDGGPGLDAVDPIAPPSESELMSELLSAPPMRGGEYLSASVFQNIWQTLDAWVWNEIRASGAGLSDWIKATAPLWHQVGRVCFHLAENKQDTDFPFAFLATYAPKLGKSGRVQYLPLANALREYAGERNKKALLHLLAPVQRASEAVDLVQDLVESGDIYHPIAWAPREAYEFLQSVPLLEESGLLVRLPDWWRKRARPRVAVTIGEKRLNSLGVDAMLDFNAALALGDELLSGDELQTLLGGDERLVRLRGQWVEVDREKLAEALNHWKRIEAEAGDGVSFIEGMRLLAGAPADLDRDESANDEVREWSFVDAGAWLADVLADLHDPQGLREKAGSSGFVGKLRPYQEAGRDWLWFLTRLGLGACLADDMGLGKTIQVLSLLLAFKEHDLVQRTQTKPSLLVLPASLLANWKAEIRRFAPSIGTVFAHPSESDAASLVALAQKPEERLRGVDLVLTTYGMLLKQHWLLEVPWRLVILDEAQAIKNPAAGQTKAAKRLLSDARIALTGTPVENRLSDLWSLFDFLCPGLLGSTARFKAFVKSLEERRHDRYAPLRNLVAPYILRRLKTDKSIITDLPDKIRMKAFCSLSKKQAALYAQSVEELSRVLAEVDGIKRRGIVLSYLMRLKQICNHPSQYLGEGDFEPDDSGKFDRLGAICEEIASRQEKVLVFTQFREMTEPIAAFLTGVFGEVGVVLHGGTPVGRRRELVDRFQSDDGPPFFVLSLKAGGTGLNLTAASHVVHFDRWWNPAVENQATDRAFRIGQHRNVTVHAFVCRGTVEERIDELLEEKTAVAEDVLSSNGEAMLTELGDKELLDIVALDIDKAAG